MMVQRRDIGKSHENVLCIRERSRDHRFFSANPLDSCFPAIFGEPPWLLDARLGRALPNMMETRGRQKDSIKTQLMWNDGWHGMAWNGMEWYGMVWNGVLFACEMCWTSLNIWSCQPQRPLPPRLPRHRLASRQRRRWPKTPSYGRATCARFLGQKICGRTDFRCIHPWLQPSISPWLILHTYT